jgi:F-type H+-transporting ATPase subunit b
MSDAVERLLEVEEKAKRIVEGAREEALRITADARDRARRIKDEAVEQAHQDAENLVEERRKEAQKQREEALQEARANAPGIGDVPDERIERATEAIVTAIALLDENAGQD